MFSVRVRSRGGICAPPDLMGRELLLGGGGGLRGAPDLGGGGVGGGFPSSNLGRGETENTVSD